MGVNTGITSRSCQVFALAVRDVLTIRVLVAFRETEIDHEYTVFGRVTPANQEVVWLDISMDDPFFVDFLNSFNLIWMICIYSYHLNADKDNRLKIELSLAGLEQVLQTRSQHVHDHHVEMLSLSRGVCAHIV